MIDVVTFTQAIERVQDCIIKQKADNEFAAGVQITSLNMLRLVAMELDPRITDDKKKQVYKVFCDKDN